MPINSHGSFSSIKLFQQILITRSQTVPSTNFEYGQIHHNLRINFGIHYEVSSRIVHPSRRSGPILHPSRPSDWRFLIFPSRALRHVKFSTNSFYSLLLASSPRYHSNTSPIVTTLSSMHLIESIQRRNLCVVINMTWRLHKYGPPADLVSVGPEDAAATRTRSFLLKSYCLPQFGQVVLHLLPLVVFCQREYLSFNSLRIDFLWVVLTLVLARCVRNVEPPPVHHLYSRVSIGHTPCNLALLELFSSLWLALSQRFRLETHPSLLLWEARSRPGCQGPQRKYAGFLSTTSWKMKLTGRRKDKVIREKTVRKKRWMELSKRSNRDNQMTHAWMEWVRTQTWAMRVCVRM